MRLSYYLEDEYETKNALSIAEGLINDSDLSIEDLMEISLYLKIYSKFRLNEKNNTQN